MTNVRYTLKGFSLLVFMFALASLAHAQATRTWVSGTGDDVNPCSRTAPCKTFAGAVSKTAEGGEIDALDPAGYGTITITKALTIDGGHGSGWASILNSGVNGVTVNIATSGINHPNDAVVILRNIAIQGVSQYTSPGLSGINFVRGAHVHVEGCQIENQATSGITVNMASSGAIYVRDTVFDNVNTAVTASTTIGPSFVYVDDCKMQGNSNGVVFGSNVSGAVNNTTFTRNIGGASGCVSASASSFVSVSHSLFSSNSLAINATAGSQVRINENEFYDNTTALGGNASSYQSGNNNKLAGNGGSVIPSGPALTNQ